MRNFKVILFCEFLIPRKSLVEIAKLEGEEVRITRGANHLGFSAGTRTIVTRLMAGQFPDYSMVLVKPDQVTAQFTVPHNQFAQALKRVALCAEERSHATKFELGFNELLLSSAASDVGNAEEGIPIEYAGESLTSGFNASYLLDLVSLEVSDVLTFEIKNAISQWQVTVPFADGKFVASTECRPESGVTPATAFEGDLLAG